MELLGFENYDDLKDVHYKWFKCGFIIINFCHIDWYNTERTHQGIRCKEKTFMETFIEGMQFYVEKNIDDRLVA
jgi:hypothetical protein